MLGIARSPLANLRRWVALLLTALLLAPLAGCATPSAALVQSPERPVQPEEAHFETDAAPPVEEATPEPFPEGTTVLHVGSSSAGALGLELDRLLEERGVKSYLKSKQSTFIAQWSGKELGLRRLLARYQPDLVVISLGGNEVETPDPARRARAIRRLTALVRDRPCIWIGTPRWPRLHHTGLLEVIRDNSAPCRFIDSDELAPDMATLSDGVHPTYPERRRWARRVIEWLELNREPNGEKPWSLRAQPIVPPAEPRGD
jgi:hypothetical protein